MRRLLLMTVILGAGMLPGRAVACSKADLRVDRIMEHCTDVFCGRVRSITLTTKTFPIIVPDSASAIPRLDSPQGEPTEQATSQEVEVFVYTFDVLASWKGAEADSMQITVVNNPACLTVFSSNEDQVVFARELFGMNRPQYDGVPVATALYARHALGQPERLAPGYDLAPVTVDDLFDALDSPEEKIRTEAVKGLGRDKENRADILDRARAMMRDGSDSEKELAANAVWEMRHDGSPAIPDLLKLITSPAPAVRSAAYWAIFQAAWPDSSVAYAIRGLSDESADVRSSAMMLLRSVPPNWHCDEILDAFERLITSSDLRMRREAMSDLPRFGCAAKRLLPLLDDQAAHDPTVASSARNAAARIRENCKEP